MSCAPFKISLEYLVLHLIVAMSFEPCFQQVGLAGYFLLERFLSFKLRERSSGGDGPRAPECLDVEVAWVMKHPSGGVLVLESSSFF